MKQRGLVILWWAVCASVVAIVWIDAFGASLQPVWAWMSANDKTASWIQALGSIAAIIGSAGVAMYLFSKELHHRRHEASERATADELAALRILQTGVMVLRVALQTCQNNTSAQQWTRGRARLAEKNLDGAIKLLTDVDGRLLPHWFELQRGVLLVSALGASAMVADLAETPFKQPKVDFTGFNASLTHLDDVFTRLRKRLYDR